MELGSLIKDQHGQNQGAAQAKAPGAPPCHDGGQGEGGVGVEQEAIAVFFDLELPLSGDDDSSLEGAEELQMVEVLLDFCGDDDDVVNQELQPARDEEAVRGAVETAQKTLAPGLAGRLRRILLKLRKPAEKPVESGGASPPQERSRSLVKGKVDAAPAPELGLRVMAGVDRRVRLKAVVKYLSKITALARRRRGDGPDLSPAGRSRASIGKRTRSSRSSVGAGPPRRSDDSVLQLQDGIENAIAHCKRSLDAHRVIWTDA
ncbi:hypothetical protein ACQ4PT_070140 [Festuca glaucescens]